MKSASVSKGVVMVDLYYCSDLSLLVHPALFKIIIGTLVWGTDQIFQFIILLRSSKISNPPIALTGAYYSIIKGSAHEVHARNLHKYNSFLNTFSAPLSPILPILPFPFSLNIKLIQISWK